MLRLLSRSLAGYLCGTHSGPLASRRRDRLGVDELASAPRGVTIEPAETAAVLGESRWAPGAEAEKLSNALHQSLERAEIVEVIVFGSQARRSTTGFSDVHAILVVADVGADAASRLRALRPHVLAAQRAVLAHQPMQHHAFEVVTPRLLVRANDSLELPAVALSETRSLLGGPPT